MPTPNDFSDYRFSSQQQDYKQSTKEERSGEYIFSNGPDAPPVAPGDYPRIFDRGYGPAVTPSSGNYPDVFSAVNVPGSNPGSGEFGQCMPGNYGPYPGTDIVPSPSPSKQFSSDKEGDPKKLVRQATKSVDAHAEIVATYGYNMPIATLGIHPWLRDELADVTTNEPGQAEPNAKPQSSGRR